MSIYTLLTNFVHELNNATMKYTFYLAYPKAEKSPVMLAIRDKSQRVTISLGVTIPVDAWDKESQRAIFCEDRKYINEIIDKADRAINKIFAYAVKSKMSLSEIANLYRRMMGLEEKDEKGRVEKSFMSFYQMWAQTSFANHKASRQTLYHFRVFQKFIGKADVSYDDITYNLYLKFLDYLNKQNYKTNMQGTFIRSLKAAMNEAHKRGYHNNLAYTQFVKPVEKVTTVSLTMDEVNRLYKAELSGAMEQARDLFILGCYTGLRFSDCTRLTKEEGNKDIITKIQQKTKEEVNIPVHPRVREILNKWNGAPTLSVQKINTHIKTICASVGINDTIEVRDGNKISYKKKWEMVSSHTARRTAATNLLLSGATIYEVSRFLGHTSVSQTQVYLRITSRENANNLAKNKFFTEE